MFCFNVGACFVYISAVCLARPPVVTGFLLGFLWTASLPQWSGLSVNAQRPPVVTGFLV